MTNKELIKKEIKRMYLMNTTRNFHQRELDVLVEQESEIDLKIMNALEGYDDDTNLNDFTFLHIQSVLNVVCEKEPVIQH